MIAHITCSIPLVLAHSLGNWPEPVVRIENFFLLFFGFSQNCLPNEIRSKKMVATFFSGFSVYSVCSIERLQMNRQYEQWAPDDDKSRYFETKSKFYTHRDENNRQRHSKGLWPLKCIYVARVCCESAVAIRFWIIWHTKRPTDVRLGAKYWTS